jgi:hypothetical protein
MSLKECGGREQRTIMKGMKDCGWWLLNVDTAEEEE